jgi:hypothetical protein
MGFLTLRYNNVTPARWVFLLCVTIMSHLCIDKLAVIVLSPSQMTITLGKEDESRPEAIKALKISSNDVRAKPSLNVHSMPPPRSLNVGKLYYAKTLVLSLSASCSWMEAHGRPPQLGPECSQTGLHPHTHSARS